MKDALKTAGIALAGIALPFLGMAISPTRDLILGLAPDEAVLQLADKIDQSRVENEAKIQQLQATLDQQQATISDQQAKIDMQEEKVAQQQQTATNTATAQSAAIESVKDDVAKKQQCATNVTKYCVSDSFMEKGKFEDYLKAYEKGFDKATYEKYKKKYTEQFNKCQEALSCK